MTNHNEDMQVLLHQAATGQMGRRRSPEAASADGPVAAVSSASQVDHVFAVGENQTTNQATLDRAYDYIVVGVGAAGSVVAGELSKTGAKVLIVESGGADTSPTISNPSVWFQNVGGPLDWSLPITPVPQLNNRKFNMALGHVLGGGTSINAVTWIRGMERDFAAWEKNGAKGWGFNDVLAIYKAQEDWEGGANAWRGAGGPIHIRRPGDPHPTAPAFIEAARQMGLPVLEDVNGPMQTGAGFVNMNVATDGTRLSSARAFLRPNLDRPNLTLMLNANVSKIVFTGDRASGVVIVSGGNVKSVSATREVILAAGAIHSAKLLMLSGVGDAEKLRKLGIKPVANLQGVGQNLQDHILVSGVIYQYKGKMPDRPPDSNAVDALAYLSSGVDNHTTDISLVLEQLPVATPDVIARFGAIPNEGFTIAPALTQPTSRGCVQLVSNDWRDAPTIKVNHLGTERDLAALLRAIEAARELGSQPAFNSMRQFETIPGAKASRTDLIDLARTASASFGHPVGTAKIGAGPEAVVDSDLRVHGLRSLRVADASVMPSIVSAPTMATAVMIGGRGAELIKGGH
jgi:choline dehydrogenase